MKLIAMLSYKGWLEQLSRQKFSPLYWVVLSLLLVGGDYLTGPYIHFPVFFLAPIILASWYNGRRWGVGLACGLSLARLGLFPFWNEVWPLWPMVVNTVIQVVVLATIVFFVGHAAVKSHEVRVLRGILPICSFCKRIRTADDTWMPVDLYITKHSEVMFSHGLCPECAREHYGNILGDSDELSVK